MRGGWGGGYKPKTVGGFHQTGGWGAGGGSGIMNKIGGNHHHNRVHKQHGGNPHRGGWGS